MIAAARVAAAIEVLDDILAGQKAEKALTTWGRAHRFAGSGDRAAIRDLVFDGLRGWRSLAAMGGSDTGRGIMIGLMRRGGADLGQIFSGVGHAPAVLGPDDTARLLIGGAVQADLPDWLFPIVMADLAAQAGTVLGAMQQRAPVFLRVNLRRGTPGMAIENLADDGIDAVMHPQVRTALQVIANERKIQASQAYLSGLVELQDAASQRVALQLGLQAGQRVLDYCAGGGGKALAMAALADVAVFAHDAAPQRMADLAARAARAGVTIAQISTSALANQPLFDVVLVDAPCSGSGTWRRTPDAKWRFEAADLAKVVQLQAEILMQAARLVAPTGTLAYVTCSMLQAENQAQVGKFIAGNPEWVLRQDWQYFPSDLGDGFYLGLLQRR